MNTTENSTVKDFFKFLGVLIALIFSAFFFFLKLMGDSNSSNEDKGLFEKGENEFNNLASSRSSSTINPINTNNIYDD